MPQPLRRLTAEGIRRFEDYLRGGAAEAPPVGLLGGKENSEVLSSQVFPDPKRVFADRYDFGCYLVDLLEPLGATEITRDRGLWTALALLWFDQLCPADASGNRRVRSEYRYVLSEDWRHYYRHLVRAPWQLVRDHRENARFLLIPPTPRKHPLSEPGEIYEQFAGRQPVLRNKPIIAAANRLYFDTSSNRPRQGVAGRGRGSARRFGLVLRQLELTYDPAVMTEEELLAILPREFDRWKDSAG